MSTGRVTRHFFKLPPKPTKWESLPRLTVLIIVVSGIVSYIAIYPHFLNPKVYPIVRSDGAGYYSYLPAYLVQHDPTFRTFVAQDLRGQTEYETGFAKNARTGNYLQRYPVGEAVMMAPFFIVGHGLAKATGEYDNGYSNIEQRAAGVAALVYMILGLLILATSLRRYSGSLVVSATLVSIVFGTSLFHYSTFDSTFSHAFSFFLLAALIELVHRWYEWPKSLKLTLGLGVIMGLILLVRQSNAVFLLLVPLFAISKFADVPARASFLWRRRLQISVMAGSVAIVLAPQLLIWHEATGRWFVNSYAGSGGFFEFTRPQILKTLFSFDPHGLFPWAPVLLLASVGLCLMWRYARALAVPFALVLVLNAYMISSWSNWYYGGGYGQRAFVDSLPMMAFPLAAVYSWVRSVVARVAVAVVVVICCGLTTVQMVHYWQLKIPFGGASWHQYLHLLCTPL